MGKRIPQGCGFVVGLLFSLNLHASNSPIGMDNPFDSQFSGSNHTAGGDWIDLQSAAQEVYRQPKVDQLLSDGRSDLTVAKVKVGKNFNTTRFQHFHQGVEVVGSQILHHTGRSGKMITDTLVEFDLDASPTLSQEEAVGIAKSLNPGFELSGTPKLKIRPDLEQNSAQLLYIVQLEGEHAHDEKHVYLNAHDGKVIANISPHIPLAPIDVKTIVRYPEGTIDEETGMVTDFRNVVVKTVVQNSRAIHGADASARRALKNSKHVLKYYKDHHNRDSYDDQNSRVINYVHFGKKLANAFWANVGNGQSFMAYGDGDGETTRDFTHALDVAGHEMTHGVISSEIELIPFGEPGALNEALADFYGELIENRDDWVLGSDIFLDKDLKKNGVRNIRNPHLNKVTYINAMGKADSATYPAHMRERFRSQSGLCDENNDRCWVHVNSTVFSHALYQVYRAVGAEIAENLIYTTMTQLLVDISNFRHTRDMTMKACQFTYNDRVCNAVERAFDKVGLNGPVDHQPMVFAKSSVTPVSVL